MSACAKQLHIAEGQISTLSNQNPDDLQNISWIAGADSIPQFLAFIDNTYGISFYDSDGQLLHYHNEPNLAKGLGLSLDAHSNYFVALNIDSQSFMLYQFNELSDIRPVFQFDHADHSKPMDFDLFHSRDTLKLVVLGDEKTISTWNILVNDNKLALLDLETSLKLKDGTKNIWLDDHNLVFGETNRGQIKSLDYKQSETITRDHTRYSGDLWLALKRNKLKVFNGERFEVFQLKEWNKMKIKNVYSVDVEHGQLVALIEYRDREGHKNMCGILTGEIKTSSPSSEN